MKVRRLLEYEGPEEWVKETLKRSVGNLEHLNHALGSGRELVKVTEVYVREDGGKVDLSKDDIYVNFKTPEEDVETCLKVLRTVEKVLLRRSRYTERDVLVAANVVLRRLVEEVEKIEEEERRAPSEQGEPERYDEATPTCVKDGPGAERLGPG